MKLKEPLFPIPSLLMEVKLLKGVKYSLNSSPFFIPSSISKSFSSLHNSNFSSDFTKLHSRLLLPNWLQLFHNGPNHVYEIVMGLESFKEIQSRGLR